MGLWGDNPKKDIQKMQETIAAAKGEELSILEFLETATKEKDKFIAAIPHKKPAELSAYASYLMEIVEFQQKDIAEIIKKTRYLERRARSRALSGSGTDKKVISLFQDLMNKVRELEKVLGKQYDNLAVNHYKEFIGHREEEKSICLAFSQIVHGLEGLIPELERVELTEKNHRSLGYAMSSLFTGIVVGSFLTVGIPTSAWAATGSSPTDTVNKGLGALEVYLHKLSEIGGRLPPGTTAVALAGLGALMAVLVVWRRANVKKMEKKALEKQQEKLGEARAKEKKTQQEQQHLIVEIKAEMEEQFLRYDAACEDVLKETIYEVDYELNYLSLNREGAYSNVTEVIKRNHPSFEMIPTIQPFSVWFKMTKKKWEKPEPSTYTPEGKVRGGEYVPGKTRKVEGQAYITSTLNDKFQILLVPGLENNKKLYRFFAYREGRPDEVIDGGEWGSLDFGAYHFVDKIKKLRNELRDKYRYS